jgi:hypothetical protein
VLIMLLMESVRIYLLRTQFSRVDFDGLGNFPGVFSLRNVMSVSAAK